MLTEEESPPRGRTDGVDRAPKEEHSAALKLPCNLGLRSCGYCGTDPPDNPVKEGKINFQNIEVRMRDIIRKTCGADVDEQ